MSLNQNLLPSEPDMQDLLDKFRQSVLLNFNCHHIGIIETFDEDLQQATVSIPYPKSFFNYDTATGLYVQKDVAFPPIGTCPVQFPGGGDFFLTFPVKPGDECLILFNDRDMDNWFAGSTNSPVNSGRLHAYADALVIVGFRSGPNTINDFNSSAVELRDILGTTKFSLTATDASMANAGGAQVATDGPLVKIKTTIGGTLGAALANLATNLQSLCTQIAAITVTTASVPSSIPNNAAAIALVAGQIATTAATIAEILA